MLLGLYTGYILYYRTPGLVPRMQQSPYLKDIRDFFFAGWGFDYLYDAILVKPYEWITRVNKSDLFDSVYNGIAQLNVRLNRLLSGNTKWIAALVCGGCINWNLIHPNLTNSVMILVMMIGILMVAGLLSWLVSRWNIHASKWISLIAVTVDFILVCNLWAQHSGNIPIGGSAWLIDYHIKWIPDFGIGFHLALGWP